MTLDELLLENRVIFLAGRSIRPARRVMMQMLYLEDQKRGQLINLYINSPGGRGRHAGCTTRCGFISSDVATYCIGRAVPALPYCCRPGPKAVGTFCPTAR